MNIIFLPIFVDKIFEKSSKERSYGVAYTQ